MANSLLVVSGRYHLGDNPGIFQNSTYVGHQLVFPVRKVWIDERADMLAFFFTASDVETLAEWKGHRVLINGTPIGRIKNTSGATGTIETVKVDIMHEEFVRLLDGNENFTLAIEYEKHPILSGQGDDFVLRRIATSTTLSVTLGWK